MFPCQQSSSSTFVFIVHVSSKCTDQPVHLRRSDIAFVITKFAHADPHVLLYNLRWGSCTSVKLSHTLLGLPYRTFYQSHLNCQYAFGLRLTSNGIYNNQCWSICRDFIWARIQPKVQVWCVAIDHSDHPTRPLGGIGHNLSSRGKRRLWSDRADAHTDYNTLCTHRQTFVLYWMFAHLKTNSIMKF